MPIDPLLPHDLDDLYGPGAEDAAVPSECEQKHFDMTDMNVFRVYMWLLDYRVDVSDDGDGYMQDAPEEVKEKHRKDIEDVETVLKLLLPHAKQYAEIHGLRTDIL